MVDPVHLTVALSAKRKAVDPGDTLRKNRQRRKLDLGLATRRNTSLNLGLSLRNASSVPFDSISQTVKGTTQIQMKMN